ncbi:MAG: hypothetical protein M1816_002620 [Peltula sp. TS41687]|nr:MAG: hypothetical protein M1816_002620 [Peltula sp. TS41687]
MGPGLVTPAPPAPNSLTKHRDNNHAPRDIFPDGIRTSGQIEPIYSLLKPYDDFPSRIEGPTVWTRDDYVNNPEKWTHRFTPQEVDELSKVIDDFIAGGLPLTGISKDSFPLPLLGERLSSVRSDLLNGKGFILFKGFPTDAWGLHKSAVGYMGLDLGEDSTQIDKTRIYRTNARQFFHCDDSDIVGLLCVARALEGGESDLVSSHAVYNALRTERPDVLKTLIEPIWYFDRKGETSDGQQEWIRTSVFYLEPKEGGRVYSKWDPYYVRSLTRFSDKGLIPPLSVAQFEAIKVLEEYSHRLALHMILEVGDIQFLSNAHVFHARTAYKDYAPPQPRRHLLKLWLATPESEGGWKLPFADSDEKKKGWCAG